MRIMTVFRSLMLVFLLNTTGLAQPSSFVSVKGHQFYKNGKPYYYIGTNYWYGTLLGLEKDTGRGIGRMRGELDFLKEHGVTNLRVFAGAEGTGLVNGVKRVGPPLQQQQGVFDENVLQSLDLLLAEMGNRNMKAVLFFSNNWEWSGGFLQYLNWNGRLPDSILRRKLDWDELRDYTSQFFTCEGCMQDYKKQVGLIINRTNSISKKKYTDDPAITAWELANEPRPMRPAANSKYKSWISNISAYIKSVDKNHLITLGHEGYMATDGDIHFYEAIHDDKNVDYLTIHIWPKNWGWFKEASFAADMPLVEKKTAEYIDQHMAVATKLQKPLVLEEFGIPRDGHSFDIDAATTLRNHYYETVFEKWKQSATSFGTLAGVNFWAFGGSSRPIKGHIFWKDGDNFMGDPPMEEQGLNSVFDADVSTWEIIRKFVRLTTGK